jgi:low affinity Fe/Cu permease
MKNAVRSGRLRVRTEEPAGKRGLVDEDQELQRGGDRALSPSEIDGQRGRFDEVAAATVHAVSRGPFFVGCIAGVLVWFALGALTGFSDTWLAAGSAVMSVVIVVLVAVLENAQRRSDQAIQRKLNAIADALGDFMCKTHVDEDQVKELRAAVGIEHRESTGPTRLPDD